MIKRIHILIGAMLSALSVSVMLMPASSSSSPALRSLSAVSADLSAEALAKEEALCEGWKVGSKQNINQPALSLGGMNRPSMPVEGADRKIEAEVREEGHMIVSGSIEGGPVRRPSPLPHSINGGEPLQSTPPARQPARAEGQPVANNNPQQGNNAGRKAGALLGWLAASRALHYLPSSMRRGADRALKVTAIPLIAWTCGVFDSSPGVVSSRERMGRSLKGIALAAGLYGWYRLPKLP